MYTYDWSVDGGVAHIVIKRGHLVAERITATPVPVAFEVHGDGAPCYEKSFILDDATIREVLARCDELQRWEERQAEELLARIDAARQTSDLSDAMEAAYQVLSDGKPALSATDWAIHCYCNEMRPTILEAFGEWIAEARAAGVEF